MTTNFDLIDKSTGQLLTLGWMDDITDFTFPSKGFLVGFFAGTLTSSDIGGAPIQHWADSLGPTIISPGVNKIFPTTWSIIKNKRVIGKTWNAFRFDKITQTNVDGWVYTRGTIWAGLKGAPFSVRNQAIGHGVDTSSTFLDGQEQIVQGWMKEFGWSHETAVGNIGFMMFLYDFLVATGVAPPNIDPAVWDNNALTTFQHQVIHTLQATKQQGFVLDMGQLKDAGATTYPMQIQFQEPFSGNFAVVALWTYNKKQKEDDLTTPKGWGIITKKGSPVPDTNPGQTADGVLFPLAPANIFPYTQHVNFLKPEKAIDYREVSLQIVSGSGAGGTTITLEVDLKTFNFTTFNLI